MPLPTQDEIETLRHRIRNAIENNIVELLGTDAEGSPIIGHDGRETLIRLYESPAASAELEAWARGLARAAGWERTRIREGLNFRPFRQEYEQRAAARRQQIAQARSALRVVGGRDTRRGGHDPSSYSGQMLAEQKMETDSIILVAEGTLETHRAGRIWYDTFHNNYFSDWDGTNNDAVVAPRPRDDAFDRSVLSWLHQINPKLAKLGIRTVVEVISTVAERDRRNEVQDWLTGLQWDGVERLHALLPEAFHTPDDDYHRAVGRCWFVSMAARAMHPGCKVDTVPVFMGAQGIRKSTALEIIGGKWYAASSSVVDNQNFLMELQGCLVFEIPELHSLTASKHGASRIKQVVTTRRDRFRPPYGRSVNEYPRTAVMAGTTNERGWHVDNTGGRRFWPVLVSEDIDTEYLTRNRDQLFAEALALYCLGWENGGRWDDVPAEEQARLIEEERHIDPWEDILGRSLDHSSLYDGWNSVVPDAGDNSTSENANFGSLITTTRIGVQWLRMTPEQTSRASRKIADIMRGLGWRQTKARAQNSRNPVRFWVRIAQPVQELGGTNSGLGGTNSGLGGTNSGEIVAPSDDEPPF